MPGLIKPNDKHIAALIALVGEEHSVSGEAAIDYSHDESPEISATPSVVLKPADETQIAEIMRYANSESIPIVPRGLGTGVAGGAVPFDGAVVLSLERLNRIIEIDTDNLMVVTQPGVVVEELQRAVKEKGLMYPPDPASQDTCSIGGNIATNAGGMSAVKYGVTRDYVKGIRAVLATGEIIAYGGKLVKNVAGYDLLHIIIGSEGTLAIVTEITLKLIPLPKCHIDLLIGFESVKAATEAVSEIIRRRIVPTSIEFMEGDIVRMVAEKSSATVPMVDAGAHLIISIDADDDEELKRRYLELGDIALELGAMDVLVADSPHLQKRLWEPRISSRDIIREVSPTIMAEDIAVPRAKLPQLWEGARKLGEKYGIRVLSFGHAGDGNLHIDALKENIPDKEWEDKMEKYVPDLLKLAVKLGGTITGEHGIGYIKRKYLHIGVGKAERELMARIKKAFDPNGILNPGKVI